MSKTIIASPLERSVQMGLFIIVGLMPFHAFLSVWLGHVFGHQALFQSWKELALVVLLGLGLTLVWREPARLQRLRQPWVYSAAALTLLALVVTAVAKPPAVLAAFGAKTDLEFLLAGLLAALVATRAFLVRLITLVLAGAAVVSAFDLLQIFILPADFLTHFGYGPPTIPPYQHVADGSRALRFPATLGGPNQLGTYLILPLCLSAALFLRQRRWWQLALLIAATISLVWTFSRGAWAGALTALAITTAAILPKRWRLVAGWGSAMAITGILLALPIILSQHSQLQYLVLHASVETHDQPNLSDQQHAASLRYGSSALLREPLGHGLGTAGPATFHSGTPNIIENYYLQLGYEAGLLGAALFIATLVYLLVALWRRGATHPLSIPIAASVIGISLVAIVLPAWVDSTTALIVWICAGAATGLAPDKLRREKNHV